MLYLVDRKIIRAISARYARQIAKNPDFPLCGIVELKDDLPNRVVVDLDDAKIFVKGSYTKVNYFLTED